MLCGKSQMLFYEGKQMSDSKGAAELRKKLAEIEFWQGTDGDPDYPEDIFGGLPDDVIDEILAILAQEVERVIGDYEKDTDEEGADMPRPIIRNQLRTEMRRKAGLV